MSSPTFSRSRTPSPVLLRPRPITHPAVNIVLVPLLPTAPERDPLPDEIWRRILSYTRDDDNLFSSVVRDCGTVIGIETALKEGQKARLSLIRVNKAFKDVVLPLLYERPYLSSFDSFLLFAQRCIEGDTKWDNLRRIHHSIPGRWVSHLNLSSLPNLSQSQYLQYTKTMPSLLAVLPLLQTLLLTPTTQLTRSAMHSLADNEIAGNLKILRGVVVPDPGNYIQLEACTSLLRSLGRLESLSLHGSGEEGLVDPEAVFRPSPLVLPNLKTLAIYNLSCSPILQVLTRADLGGLKSLTIALEEDTDAERLFDKLSGQLEDLTLLGSGGWPASESLIPNNLLSLCPELKRLSLPSLPTLFPPQGSARSQVEYLSISRPTAEFLNVVEKCFPCLKEVKVRDVRYLKRSLGVAGAAGAAGLLMEWRRRLGRRGVVVRDGAGRSGP